MKEKFETQDIDFKGCHSAIADALRSNKSIKCYISDNNPKPEKSLIYTPVWIVGFCTGTEYKYISKNGTSWQYATPIPAKEVYVKDALSIMESLIATGHTVDSKGVWRTTNSPGFNISMWKYCGKRKQPGFVWKKSWLEEK